MANYTTEQLDALRAAHPIVERARLYTDLTKIAANEYAGPCPKCGGTDRFHVSTKTERASCRECHGMAEWLDVFALEQWVHECNFMTAVHIINDEPKRLVSVQCHKPVERPKNAWSSETWQKAARQTIEKATHALHSREGQDGRGYLLNRGITLTTAEDWCLGYDVQRRAIVLPWLTPKAVMNVQYRRIDALGKTERFVRESGGTAVMYGLHLLDTSAPTLVLVEGEMNAISIWQSARALGITVLSVGSQALSEAASKAAKAIARHFNSVLVWCDELERAQSVAGLLDKKAHPICSPKGLDGNDMLVAGILEAFLKEVLGPVQPVPTMPQGIDVQRLRKLLRRALHETTVFIPAELCDFDDDTSMEDMWRIATNLHQFIAVHRRPQKGVVA